MSDERPRKPAAFRLDAPAIDPAAEARSPASFTPPVTVTPDEEDPFLGTPLADPAADMVALPARRGWSWGGFATLMLGTLVSLATGLWIDQLIEDLFSRSDWLGWLAAAATALLVLSLLVIMVREWAALARLSAVQALRKQGDAAARDPRPGPARAVIATLSDRLKNRPETATGRAALALTEGDIIDGPGLIRLAERELLGPLDDKARQLVMASAKRVSVVTAVSPRALVDLAYVGFEAARLIRTISELYGTRPGKLGFLRLFRDVLSHLAVTGSIAVGDSLIQQFIGHGLASRLSARLGEGVINGLMTARIGIAAMDLCRPLPFQALKRPGIGDFLGDIMATTKD